MPAAEEMCLYWVGWRLSLKETLLLVHRKVPPGTEFLASSQLTLTLKQQ